MVDLQGRGRLFDSGIRTASTTRRSTLLFVGSGALAVLGIGDNLGVSTTGRDSTRARARPVTLVVVGIPRVLTGHEII